MYFFNIKYDEFICSEVWAGAVSCYLCRIFTKYKAIYFIPATIKTNECLVTIYLTE